jgi:hypothetical protein
MATKFIPNKIYEASLPSTSTEGYVYITEKKNF